MYAHAAAATNEGVGLVWSHAQMLAHSAWPLSKCVLSEYIACHACHAPGQMSIWHATSSNRRYAGWGNDTQH